MMQAARAFPEFDSVMMGSVTQHGAGNINRLPIAEALNGFSNTAPAGRVEKIASVLSHIFHR